MKCSLKNGSFYFECEGFKHSIYMKDEQGYLLTPKEDVINFLNNFLNNKHCKLSFDDEQSILYDSNNIVQFENPGTILHIDYDICKDAIIDYLSRL